MRMYFCLFFLSRSLSLSVSLPLKEWGPRTRAMKFFKRERTQKIPFIIDMASLCTTFIIVVVVITVLITGF